MRRRMLLGAVLGLVWACGLTACGELPRVMWGPAEGEIGWSCTNDRDCHEGLRCLGGICDDTIPGDADLDPDADEAASCLGENLACEEEGDCCAGLHCVFLASVSAHVCQPEAIDGDTQDPDPACLSMFFPCEWNGTPCCAGSQCSYSQQLGAHVCQPIPLDGDLVDPDTNCTSYLMPCGDGFPACCDGLTCNRYEDAYGQYVTDLCGPAQNADGDTVFTCSGVCNNDPASCVNEATLCECVDGFFKLRSCIVTCIEYGRDPLGCRQEPEGVCHCAPADGDADVDLDADRDSDFDYDSDSDTETTVCENPELCQIGDVFWECCPGYSCKLVVGNPYYGVCVRSEQYGSFGDPCPYGVVHADKPLCAEGFTCLGLYADGTDTPALVCGYDADCREPESLGPLGVCAEGYCGESFCSRPCSRAADCQGLEADACCQNGFCMPYPFCESEPEGRKLYEPCTYPLSSERVLNPGAGACAAGLFCEGRYDANAPCRLDADCRGLYGDLGTCVDGFCGLSYCSAYCPHGCGSIDGCCSDDATCIPRVLCPSSGNDVYEPCAYSFSDGIAVNGNSGSCKSTLSCIGAYADGHHGEEPVPCTDSSYCQRRDIYGDFGVCMGGYCGMSYCASPCTSDFACARDGVSACCQLVGQEWLCVSSLFCSLTPAPDFAEAPTPPASDADYPPSAPARAKAK